ncbi:nitrilase-related carbon-nitrogen hydrolase [Streptomyces sp. NPDC001222]|uniref:nitrilase-related carbon-nitrogen hydrolase n=1 Tax=Streptomyces sp. NPDC001222 TaxID=3364548 RepID=UPI00368387B0
MTKERVRLLKEAVAAPSAATDAVAEAAREAPMVVSIGVNERDGGTIYNTRLRFDADGEQIHAAMCPGPSAARRSPSRRGQHPSARSEFALLRSQCRGLTRRRPAGTDR